MHTDPPKTAQSIQPAQTDVKRYARKLARRRPITAPAEKPGSPARLRLVGMGAPDAKLPIANPTPINSATDPRWVLAVRTAELLEGDVLPPNKRDTLMRTGKMMGLTAFDCSLILAIVQDRARRGIAPEQCPAAGEPQLALIPLPSMRSFKSVYRDKPVQIALMAMGLLTLQGLLLWVLLS